MHVHARGDGIDADLGAGTVTALALERDAEPIDARERRVAVEHKPDRRLAVHVHGKPGRRRRALEQPVGNGGTGTLKGLLAGLEQQLDGTAELRHLFFARLEQLGGAEQRRGMHVMPAGMHAAVLARKGLTRLLGNGQRVHVAAKQDGVAAIDIGRRAILGNSRGTFADQCDDAVAVNECAERNAHLAQAFLHIGARLRQVVGKLRDLMQRVAPLSELAGDPLGLLEKFGLDRGGSSLARCGSELRRNTGKR